MYKVSMCKVGMYKVFMYIFFLGKIILLVGLKTHGLRMARENKSGLCINFLQTNFSLSKKKKLLIGQNYVDEKDLRNKNRLYYTWFVKQKHLNWTPTTAQVHVGMERSRGVSAEQSIV